MSIFNDTIRDYVTAALQLPEFDPRDVAEQIIAENEDLIRDEGARLVRDQVRILVANLTKERPEDTGQLSLFRGLPRAVRVEANRYVPTDHATWADLLAGRQERVENIAHAEKALELYDEDLARLRPYMADDPDMTVEEAARRYQADHPEDDEAE